MKLLITAGLVGASAAAAAAVVGSASSCVPGLVRAGSSFSDSTISIQAACGARLNASGPHGVFAAPTTGGGGSSLVGVYVPGAAELSADTFAVRQDLVAGEKTVLVMATDENGRVLVQSFAVHPPAAAPSDEGTTSLHEQRSSDNGSTTTAACDACNSPEVLCQPACQDPPQTCAFYSSCAEAAVPCGAAGYALGYGLANCDKFARRLPHFSAAGRRWVLAVLTCLQRFLIAGPLTRRCGLTCAALRTAAFGSHPACYVDAGVCDLPARDWVQLVLTIGSDLATLDTLRQAVTTGGRCLGRWRAEIEEELARLRGISGLLGGEDRAGVAAEMAVLEAVERIF